MYNIFIGITLESLGGVFIATLFGLVLALVTLVSEILYYKRMENKEKSTRISIQSDIEEKKAPENQKIILGSGNFVPVSEKKPKVSYISVFPRNALND